MIGSSLTLFSSKNLFTSWKSCFEPTRIPLQPSSMSISPFMVNHLLNCSALDHQTQQRIRIPLRLLLFQEAY